MEYAIELKDVCKKYKGFSLDNVSFSLPKGSIMGFVGENGAGKSTTLKSILDIVHPDKGVIKVLGCDKNNIQSIKEEIGVVFDECYFHDNLKLTSVSKILNKIYKNWNQESFLFYTKKFKLPADKVIKEYSRGMKMKLSIAVALSHKAKLLILDEATSGLDPIVRDEILDIFMDFIQDENNSVLISSHIISDLEKVADYITFIHEGKIKFSESKDNLIYNYGMVRCKKDDFSKIDDKYIVGVRRNSYGVEVLIKNKKEFERENRGLLVESTSIEDIILMQSNPNKKGEESL